MKNPLLYEINTWIWLRQLSERYAQTIRLGNIPDQEWADLAKMGFNAVWLMGVWERSTFGRDLVLNNPIAINEFKHELPGYKEHDLVGSPYSVRSYTVDTNLGGQAGLAIEREKMAAHGIKLILDYVPNHIAPDHAWCTEHPDYLMPATKRDVKRDSFSYLEIGSNIFARGKDPNFPAWMDTIQLNAFSPGMRQATLQTLQAIAEQCDGVRCDMAMLLINRIFHGTWGKRAGHTPQEEYWPAITRAVKSAHPGFLFIAEAYWDTEAELHTLGFDYCYDKLLYDLIRDQNADKLRGHLSQSIEHQAKLVRFIENHDEPRAVTAFPKPRWQAAAVASLTLPGMRMLHHDQLIGRTRKVSVLLGRWPDEQPNPETQKFYQRLLPILQNSAFKEGNFTPLAQVVSDDEENYCGAWLWTNHKAQRLVVVNIGAQSTDITFSIPGANQKLWKDLWNGVTLDLDHGIEQTITCAPWQFLIAGSEG